MCSTLIFRHGKLSMRTFFTHVAITDQNLFYFFTLITLMIAHSAEAGSDPGKTGSGPIPVLQNSSDPVPVFRAGPSLGF